MVNYEPDEDDDDSYDKYEDMYSESEMEFAQEYFSDGDESFSRKDAVDALEDAGVDGQTEDEYYGR